MCQFCVQHGDGKTWYLQAENYAADLESDLKRRDYLIDFVQGFDTMRSRAFTWLDVLEKAPTPIERAVKRGVNKRQQLHHYGQPVPIEDCERIFDLATSIVHLPCVCRTAAGGPEQGYCLAVTATPIPDTLVSAFRGYANGPDVSGLDTLTKEQAMTLLRRCETEGLMHSVWTFITPFIGAICNCDVASGCMAMTMTLTHDVQVMWRGENVIELAEESCSRCGACAMNCPFNAIDFDRPTRTLTVRQQDCYGCGVCRAVCRKSALTLVPRESVPEVAGIW